MKDIGVHDGMYFAIPEELLNNDLKKSGAGIGINLEGLRLKNYQLTDTQVKVIQESLERHYYNCKDDGDIVGMNECIKLEKILKEGE